LPLAVYGKVSMPENVQNRQVQSIMCVIMSSKGPGVRAVHPDLGLRPNSRAFPYSETARLSAEEIFCLVSCLASTAKKYVPLLSNYLFVTRDFF
jgi:hypothetical protein